MPKPRIPKPLGDKLYVRCDRDPSLSDGGILIPEIARSTRCTGKVVAVGKDSTLSPGDHILFAAYTGKPLYLDHEMLWILEEEDVLATLHY